jgi:hypothetical protein
MALPFTIVTYMVSMYKYEYYTRRNLKTSRSEFQNASFTVPPGWTTLAQLVPLYSPYTYYFTLELPFTIVMYVASVSPPGLVLGTHLSIVRDSDGSMADFGTVK